jgi:DNA repair protein RecO (recombination protein O)
MIMMPLARAQGIVLKQINVGESDKIITLFTDRLGKIQAVVHGARKAKSKFMSSTQVFAYCEYVLYKGKSLYTINQSEIIESFQVVLDDLYSLTYSSYIVELADVLTQNEEVNIDLFVLLLKTMYLMTDKDIDRELLIRAFELKAISISGYMPNLMKCSLCGSENHLSRFSIHLGSTICDNCASKDRNNIEIGPPTLNAMKYMMKIGIEKVRTTKISRGVKNDMKKIMKNYIKYYLDKDFKSLEFLDDIEHIDNI